MWPLLTSLLNKVPAVLMSGEVNWFGWVRWLTLNNRRQLIGPKPDSRPRLEGARYKYLTRCSRLLSPSSSFSHAHSRTHHQPDSSPPGLAQWACHKTPQRMGPESTLDSCPKEQAGALCLPHLNTSWHNFLLRLLVCHFTTTSSSLQPCSKIICDIFIMSAFI